MKTIIFYLWLIVGIITLNSNGEISKLSYFLCWIALMFDLVCDKLKNQLTDELIDEIRDEINRKED